jgi:hypothetical protein
MNLACSSVVQQINDLHAELVTLAQSSLEKAVRIGELLSKEKVITAHGRWLPWIKSNLTFSQQTASNYMRLYQHRKKLPTVGNLGLTDAYRLLADAPDKAKKVHRRAVAVPKVIIVPSKIVSSYSKPAAPPCVQTDDPPRVQTATEILAAQKNEQPPEAPVPGDNPQDESQFDLLVLVWKRSTPEAQKRFAIWVAANTGRDPRADEW